MTNATPFVESFEYAFVSGIRAHLGWQLQGHQFRRTVIYHDESIRGRSEESHRLREAVSREHPEFYTFPAHLPQTAAGRKEFNHFAPSSVLKYVKTPNLTISELKAAAAVVHAEIEQMRVEAVDESRPADAQRKAP